MCWRTIARSLLLVLALAAPASAQTVFSHTAGTSGFINYISTTGVRVAYWDFTSTTADPTRNLGVGGCAEVAFLLDQDISGADATANVGIYSRSSATATGGTLIATISTEEVLTYQIVGGFLGVTVAADPGGGVTSRLQVMCHTEVSPQTCTSAGGPDETYRMQLLPVIGTPNACATNSTCDVNDDFVKKVGVGSTYSVVATEDNNAVEGLLRWMVSAADDGCAAAGTADLTPTCPREVCTNAALRVDPAGLAITCVSALNFTVVAVPSTLACGTELGGASRLALVQCRGN